MTIPAWLERLRRSVLYVQPLPDARSDRIAYEKTEVLSAGMVSDSQA